MMGSKAGHTCSVRKVRSALACSPNSSGLSCAGSSSTACARITWRVLNRLPSYRSPLKASGLQAPSVLEADRDRSGPAKK